VVVIATDPDDPNDEPILIRDYFNVTRTNFLIKAPTETSYPSVTYIQVSWDKIEEKPDATEEKIIYYSLEWD
jgi:hypothetical protein